MERNLDGTRTAREVKEDKPEVDKGGRPCLTCSHPKRIEIEKAIIDGMPYMQIARNITMGSPLAGAITKHANKCVPELLGLRSGNASERAALSREELETYMRSSLEQAAESAERAMTEEDDESGRLLEGATGRTAALKAQFDIAKGTGEALGLIESKTKVEVIFANPEVVELIDYLISIVPDDKVQEAQEKLALWGFKG